jgi:hypothetical protein
VGRKESVEALKFYTNGREKENPRASLLKPEARTRDVDDRCARIQTIADVRARGATTRARIVTARGFDALVRW